MAQIKPNAEEVLLRILNNPEFDKLAQRVVRAGLPTGTEPLFSLRTTEMVTKQKVDMVNHPPHYTQGEIECIDAIRAAIGREGFIAFLRGQVIKYTWRQGEKQDKDNAAKCAWYQNKLVEVLAEEE